MYIFSKRSLEEDLITRPWSVLKRQKEKRNNAR